MNPKSKMIWIVTILFTVFLCSCDHDPYAGQRPMDYSQSRWICEEYNISFSVGEKYELLDAVMEIDGEIIPFEFTWWAFHNVVNIDFEVDGKADYMQGTCRFGEKQFSIYIENTTGYYTTKEVTLEFERVE